MVLQNWILPDFSLGLPEVLYFGKRTNASIDSASGRVILDAGGTLDFESYFNAFNTGDWRRCAALQSPQQIATGCGLLYSGLWSAETHSSALKPVALLRYTVAK